MWLSDISVKRPVFATVIAMLLLAFGALAFNGLELREYPDISAPVISVSVLNSPRLEKSYSPGKQAAFRSSERRHLRMK